MRIKLKVRKINYFHFFEKMGKNWIFLFLFLSFVFFLFFFFSWQNYNRLFLKEEPEIVEFQVKKYQDFLKILNEKENKEKEILEKELKLPL